MAGEYENGRGLKHMASILPEARAAVSTSCLLSTVKLVSLCVEVYLSLLVHLMAGTLQINSVCCRLPKVRCQDWAT